jgi:hypothetical protein
MTLILFGIDKFCEWAWPDYRARLHGRFSQELRRRFFWGVVTLLLFVAGFQAWKDERTRVEDLKKSQVVYQTGLSTEIASRHLTKVQITRLTRMFAGLEIPTTKIIVHTVVGNRKLSNMREKLTL